MNITLLEKFENYLLLEKGLSNNTIESYLNDIKIFSQFMQNKDFTSITSDEIIKYIGYLRKNYSQNSVVRKISSLKAIFTFFVKDSYIKSSPTNLIDKIKRLKKLPNYLEYESVVQLINSIGDSSREVRDKLIIKLLIGSGARISEILTLGVKDIDFESHTLKIIGKGNKMRILPLDLNLEREIKEYIENVRRSLIPRGSLDKFELFPSITRQNFWQRLRYYTKRAGINKELYPHIFRHTLATIMLDNGASIRTVQEILGHSSISTTEIYTHVSKTTLRSIYDSADIRGEL